MEQGKEKLQPIKCDWCQPDKNSGRDTLELAVGPGVFRDFDSDLSYGIPVCGGCGGLGVQFETKDFSDRTKRIMDLRFEYCPTDPEKFDEMTDAKRLAALVNIEKEVKDLVKTYGHGSNGSLADQVSKGKLANLITELRSRVKLIEEIRNTDTKGDRVAEALKEPSIALFEGRRKAADKGFQETIGKFPQSSLPQHDYAVFILNTEENYGKALPHLIKSTELEPKKAVHFYQTAKCLAQMGRYKEAKEWLGKTSKQPDYKDFVKESGQDADILIEEINKMLSSKQNGFDTDKIIQ